MGDYVKKRELLYTENVNGQSPWEISMEVCQKTTIWPSNSTSGHISERNKTTNSKEYNNPNVQIVLFKIAKILKQHECPSTDEWINKEWYTHTHSDTTKPYRRNKVYDLLQHGWTGRVLC